MTRRSAPSPPSLRSVSLTTSPTCSFKSDKERSKSSTMLGATSRPKKGGSGAGKHNWGNERDECGRPASFPRPSLDG